jgi:hypothetical protein
VLRYPLLLSTIVIGSCLLVGLPDACAQTRSVVSAHSTTPQQASADAYRRAEARRRYEVAQHAGTIDYIQWLNGAYVPRAYPFPADRADYYGYFGRSRRSAALGVFERWPYLPGDIWGFSYRPSPVGSTVRGAPFGKRRAEAQDSLPDESPSPEAIRRGPVSY